MQRHQTAYRIFPRSRYWILLLLLPTLLMLAACGSASDEEEGDSPITASGDIVGLAPVDEVELVLSESFPVQVSAIANGIITDNCTEIGELSSELTGNLFTVNITTVRRAVGVCDEIEEPYQETIDLEVEGLKAGMYEVLVNGISADFELSKDNSLATPVPTEEPEPEPEEASDAAEVPDTPATAAARVALAVDLGVEEAVIEVISAEEAEWPDACLGLAADDELCLLQVTPGYKVVMTVDGTSYTYRTNDSGLVVRAETADAAAAPGDGAATEDGEEACKNAATFVKDVTVPDNTRLKANKDFVKTWRLRNIGTCTWTTEYALLFASGDQMNGPDLQPLATSVAPGKSIDISAQLVAPSEKGKYKGEWKLQDASATEFGIGKNASKGFWVQIQVPKSAPAPVGGTISGFTWHDLCAAGDGSAEAAPTGCIEAESGGYVGDGVYEEQEPRIGGLEMVLGQGACPSTGLAQTIADAKGVYAFTRLDAGTYCVTIDSLSQHNTPILMPGVWTYPADSSGSQTVEVGENEEVKDINFGWDYEFAP